MYNPAHANMTTPQPNRPFVEEYNENEDPSIYKLKVCFLF